MATGKPDTPGVSASVRVYRVLLRLYPAKFRAEYEREMVQTFRDMARTPGENLTALWVRTLRDTITSAFNERCDAMNKDRLALLVLAVGAGLAIAWVDSRPNWDDTGITAGALLLTSAVFGAASPRSPWHWALAIGIWVPALGILRQGNFSMLLVLLFTFIGAYLGAFLRKTFAPPRPSSNDGA